MSTTHKIAYFLGGDATEADITYNADANGAQQTHVLVPLKADDGKPGFRFVADAGQFLYISAQQTDDEPATITCTITEDGRVVVRHQSAGQYSIVTCQSNA